MFFNVRGLNNWTDYTGNGKARWRIFQLLETMMPYADLIKFICITSNERILITEAEWILRGLERKLGRERTSQKVPLYNC